MKHGHHATHRAGRMHPPCRWEPVPSGPHLQPLATTNSCFYEFRILDPRMRETVRLGLALTRFTEYDAPQSTHVVVTPGFPSFSWLNNIPPCTLPLYLFTRRWALRLPLCPGCCEEGCGNAGCRGLFKTVISFPSDIYPEVGLGNSVVVPVLIF